MTPLASYVERVHAAGLSLGRAHVPVGCKFLFYLRRSLHQQKSPAALKAERPRARNESEPERTKRTLYQWGGLTLGVGAVLGGLALIAHATGRTVSEAVQDVMDNVLSLGKVDAEDISGSLPPWEVYSDPLTGAEGIPRGPVLLRVPTATVVLGWEGTCVDVVYDPRAGYVPLPRPGLVDLLLACADADVEIAIWSCTASAAVVQEQLRKLVVGLVAQEDADRYGDFRKFVIEGYERSRVAEAASSAHDGRPPRPVMPVTDADVPEYYTQCVLRIAGVLGKELCHVVGQGAGAIRGRDVELLGSGRSPSSLLLILREDEVPACTIHPEASVLAVPAFSGSTPGKTGIPPSDPTFMLLSALVRRFGECVRGVRAQGEGGEGHGVPHMKTYVAGLDSAAVAAGLRPDTGRAVDFTVGVLGQVLRDERRKLKEKQQLPAVPVQSVEYDSDLLKPALALSPRSGAAGHPHEASPLPGLLPLYQSVPLGLRQREPVFR